MKIMVDGSKNLV